MNKLTLGDAFDSLNEMQDSTIDCIITDPPYGIKYSDWDLPIATKNITEQFYRVLKDNGSVFFFAGWSSVVETIKNFDKRFLLNDWIIYDRIKGRGALKRLVSTREDILWYVKNENSWTFNKDKAYSTIVKKTKGMGEKNGRNTRALSNVWSDISPLVPWGKEKVNHPTQKPVQLMERIVETFTNENDTILDCFIAEVAQQE